MSYIDTADLSSFSSEELLSFYCNAASTDYGALGHTKGHMNKTQATAYAAELDKRGEFVPDYGDAAKVGSFNGRGSL